MNASLSHLTSCIVLLLVLTGAVASDEPTTSPVSVTDLGTLGGSSSTGYGVNNKGQVAGTSLMPGDKAAHGFLYADGKMADLGTLGGDQSEARALNDAGQVTGNSDIRGKHKHHAFLWQQGHMSELGTSRGDDSDGLAINSAGQVVGRIIRDGSFFAHACLWLGGKVDSLDDSDIGSSECTAINGSGQVVGALRESGPRVMVSGIPIYYSSDHAILWQRHRTSALSTPDTRISLANAINDSGQVAGAASFGKDMLLHACSWQDGKMTDLGTLGGQTTVAYAINRAGQTVGGTNPDDLEENGKTLGDKDQPQLAFCCSGGKMRDLNNLIDPASGWVLAEARGISDTGYVTGTGIHNGQAHAYLLKLPTNF